MSEAVKIELTLERDTVEAFFKMISSLAASLSAQMSDTKSDMMSDKEENEEESNKEEVKEEKTIRINTSNKTDKTDNNNTNNNINNNCVSNDACMSIPSNNLPVSNSISNDTSTKELTMDQILGYMSQKGYKFDPKKFYNYYRGMGWKTKNGRDILPIWQQAIDTWARTEYDRGTYKAATTPNKVGMGTREERMAAHPFVPTDFNEFAPV